MSVLPQKRDMARLIALHNAGAEADLARLLSSLKETRSRSRRMHSSAHNGRYSPAYPGYVTTTAEADSASASPDLEDDDEEMFSSLAVRLRFHFYREAFALVLPSGGVGRTGKKPYRFRLCGLPRGLVTIFHA